MKIFQNHSISFTESISSNISQTKSFQQLKLQAIVIDTNKISLLIDNPLGKQDCRIITNE